MKEKHLIKAKTALRNWYRHVHNLKVADEAGRRASYWMRQAHKRVAKIESLEANADAHGLWLKLSAKWRKRT